MGHAETCVFDLALFRLATQLRNQFEALRKSGRTQRMTFGEQSAG